jgi:hypothetical protein
MEVYLPFFGAHSRVDLVATSATEVLRVQCKTSRIIDGVVYFRTCSLTANVHLDYRGQVDAFGVYSPEHDLVYLVPVDDAPLQACHLRIDATRNNQRTGIRWASDYLIGSP